MADVPENALMTHRPAKQRVRDMLRGVYRSSRNLGYRTYNSLSAPYSKIYYIVEGRDWSIYWDGQYISRNIREQTGIPCRTTRNYRGIARQVVHFGSRSTYLREAMTDVDPSNRILYTWFHGSDEDADSAYFVQRIAESLPNVSRIVTSCDISRRRLRGWGVPEEKIAMIPLGVDLELFRQGKAAERRDLRTTLGIAEDAMCIGYFQKDGVGWGDGAEPKLIKGPDIFLKAIADLAPRHNIFVLLTGPARGYVKNGLDEIGVPYRHTYLENYLDIVPYYHCLDLYMITSRDEGGPKAILESMATGVPVVSTRVGMAPDLINDGENGLLADAEDIDSISEAAERFLKSAELRRRCSEKGLITAAKYDWSTIAKRYYHEVYEPLMASR